MTSQFCFEPIAYFKTNSVNPIDSPQQGVFAKDAEGTIDLHQFKQHREMLKELERFSHLWIIFIFHHNKEWKPLELPPRSENKVGVFASRSPYRPNPIGISAVEIVKIEKGIITVKNHDLLDGTPILDIKPYIKYADSFTRANTGWLVDTKEYKIKWSKLALEQMRFLNQWPTTKFKSIITQQLMFNPMDKKRKRVKKVSLDQQSRFYVKFRSHLIYELSIRTWRVVFAIPTQDLNLDPDPDPDLDLDLDKLKYQLSVLSIHSGYSNSDFERGTDPYRDLEIHSKFNKVFKNNKDI